MNLPVYIKNISNFSAETEEEFKASFKREEFPKTHMLFQYGLVCNHIYYIDR